jgi:hypothetical protein
MPSFSGQCVQPVSEHLRMKHGMARQVNSNHLRQTSIHVAYPHRRNRWAQRTPSLTSAASRSDTTLSSAQWATRRSVTDPCARALTLVYPRGKANADVFGAWFTLHGDGEMTGNWLHKSGILEGPIPITKSHSVGSVREAILQWQVSWPHMQY